MLRLVVWGLLAGLPLWHWHVSWTYGLIWRLLSDHSFNLTLLTYLYTYRYSLPIPRNFFAFIQEALLVVVSIFIVVGLVWGVIRLSKRLPNDVSLFTFVSSSLCTEDFLPRWTSWSLGATRQVTHRSSLHPWLARYSLSPKYCAPWVLMISFRVCRVLLELGSIVGCWISCVRPWIFCSAVLVSMSSKFCWSVTLSLFLLSKLSS